MFVISDSPTIKEVQDLYKTKKATVKEVVAYFINRVKKLDKDLSGVVRMSEEKANKTAENLDALFLLEPANEVFEKKPLFGIPFVIKDNVLVEGLETTSQSRILEGFTAPYSADVYANLEKAGAVLIAQTNMDEFAFGSSTEFSGFGQVTKNPSDKGRVAGGTSGGSAVCVASGQCVFAVGTDTGGSIRQPASFCGVVGIRPTYGLLSRYGVMASTSSFDQPGPITNSVEDSKLVLSAMKGKTSNDQTCLNFEEKIDNQNKELSENKAKLSIGVPKQAFGEGIKSEVKKKFEHLFEKLEKDYEIVPIDLKTTRYNISTYYILQTVEAAANMERYDGIRYGKQSKTGDLFYTARNEFLGDETKRRIMLGTYTSSAGYYDAYYNQACRVREKIRNELNEVLEKVDILITPVSPFPAFKIGENSDDPMSMYLADIMTSPQPMAKLPAISVPIGDIEYEGSFLPVGAQITGKELSEDLIYKLAGEIEKNNF